ncbi:MAG TPA: NAD(+) synthase [Thermoanaerobaculia bacterium]|jgi:NAD+ synthase (glutamine-hydrolysing)|nr:NAD(+) synthase [Thermoanaerobaculia bacterium]
MRLIKIGIGSADPTVGAVRSNVDRVLAQAREMAAEGVTVGCFTEQVVGGYPPEDLVQWRAFLDAQRAELERFAAETAETADTATVFVVGIAVGVGGQIFNCAAVVHGGAILGFVPKEKLPTYNVFYEARTFSRGAPGLALEAGGVPVGDYLFEFDFGLLAVEVCEDVWSPDGPMRRRCYSGAELVVNVSSSPFRVGVVSTRREMLATRSADNQATLVYANMVGAQDGLVFDGGGFVFQNGRPMLEASRFQEGWAACVVDLDRTLRARREASTWRSDCEAFQRQEIAVPVIQAGKPTGDRSGLSYPAPAWTDLFLPSAGRPGRTAREEVLDDLIEALALGVKDYFQKSGAFRSLGIALSGGRDSMLTLLIAWRAAQLLGKESLIQAFYMPTRYSGEGTRDAARILCEELGVALRVVPIEEAFGREVEATREMLGGGEPTEITRQNVQARIRANRMWNWANSSGALFLQTGDMSEKAVGYTTIGGDLEGALSVIANVPKTVVVALLERFLERFGFAGVRRTLETEPGPELAAEQTAEGELMPFAVLDACLWLYAGEKLSPAEVARALRSMFPQTEPERLETWAGRFAVLFTRSIYKWVQSPLALHVGSLDLDRERALQLPVVQRSEWPGTGSVSSHGRILPKGSSSRR